MAPAEGFIPVGGGLIELTIFLKYPIAYQNLKLAMIHSGQVGMIRKEGDHGDFQGSLSSC
jgi:hypothetical protein